MILTLPTYCNSSWYCLVIQSPLTHTFCFCLLLLLFFLFLFDREQAGKWQFFFFLFFFFFDRNQSSDGLWYQLFVFVALNTVPTYLHTLHTVHMYVHFVGTYSVGRLQSRRGRVELAKWDMGKNGESNIVWIGVDMSEHMHLPANTL